MPIAKSHPERVAGLCSMAMTECKGDPVVAFAALLDSAVAIAGVAGVSPELARRRMSQTFALTIHQTEL